MRFINIGFGNVVAAQRILAVLSPDSAPIKRIAALRAADQKFILQDPHLKSRLTPAAMAAMSSIVEIEEIFSL